MRFGLDRMRRLTTALGSPQERFGSIHVVGTNGKSSTARMTAAILEAHGAADGAYLSPHLVSFAERVRIGDAGRRARALRGAVQRAAHAAEQGRPHARGGRPRHPVRGAHRRGVRRARRRRRRGRGRRGRPRRALRRHERHPLARAGADERRARAHALAGADGRRHRPREARRRAPRRHARGRRRPHPDAAALARRVAAERGARLVVAPAEDGRPRWRPAPSSGATSRSRRPPPRRWLDAPLAVRRCTRPPRRVVVPGRFEIVDDRAGHDPRRRAQPGRHGGAGRGAARDAGDRPGGRRDLDPRRQGRRRDAARAAAAVQRARLHGEREPAGAVAGDARVAGAAARRAAGAHRRRPAARAGAAAAGRGPRRRRAGDRPIYLVADLRGGAAGRRRSRL